MKSLKIGDRITDANGISGIVDSINQWDMSTVVWPNKQQTILNNSRANELGYTVEYLSDAKFSTYEYMGDDWRRYRFLGHFAEHDVWLYKYSNRVTLLVRYGNIDREYASFELSHFTDCLQDNSLIGSDNPKWTMGYQQYMFSGQVTKYHMACLLALAANFKS